jgi:histidinol-phosphate aminotransferase
MYGMYAVCTQANDISIIKVNLELTAEGGEEEKRDVPACVWMTYVSISVLGLNIVNRRVMQVKKTIDADPSIKLIFLCSPGNPTGTLISLASIRALL